MQGGATKGGAPISGYEMHMGVSDGPDRARPFLIRTDGSAEGACSADGLVAGTYLHGLFAADEFRRHYLQALYPQFEAGPAFEAMIEETLDALAAHLETHLAIDRVIDLAQRRL